MTLISHRAQFIFLKTYKTAGTSIEVALEPLCLPEGAPSGAHYREAAISSAGIVGARGRAAHGQTWKAHMSARAVRAAIGADIWRRYRKITVVRNPFERTVSQFFFSLDDEDRAAAAASFDEAKRAFRRWLPRADLARNMNKLLIRGRFQPDHVLFYETLAADFAALQRGLGQRPTGLPHLKAGSRVRPEAWPDFYDMDARRIVEKGCAFELAYFGYSFEGGPQPGRAADRAKRLLLSSPRHLACAWREPRLPQFEEV